MQINSHAKCHIRIKYDELDLKKLFCETCLINKNG
jgi:hypothetical protein